MELIGLIAALGAALAWASSSLISTGPARALGSLAFNRWRQLFVFVLLGSIATIYGGWKTLESSDVSILLLSGFVGIFIGDTALFATLSRLGPRRTNLVFSTHAPMTVVLGALFLNEHLAAQAMIGIALVVAGSWVAIVYGKRRDQLHTWEQIKGPLLVGVGLGLLAALGQAIGVLIAKPVMQSGVDPIAAAALRVGIAGLALTLLRAVGLPAARAKTPLTKSLWIRVALSGTLGMALGMSLYLFGLKYADAGLVAVLSSTTPVLMLPLLWIITKERPALMAFVGALMATGGTALIFTA